MSQITVSKGQLLKPADGAIVVPADCMLSLRIDFIEVALCGPGNPTPTTAPFQVVALSDGVCSVATEWDAAILGRNVICALKHDITSRLARRLLKLDRACRPGGWIAMTQDELAAAMKVRRQSVNLEIGNLRADKLIEINRGKLRVISRNRLAAVACSCAIGD